MLNSDGELFDAWGRVNSERCPESLLFTSGLVIVRVGTLAGVLGLNVLLLLLVVFDALGIVRGLFCIALAAGASGSFSASDSAVLRPKAF